MHHAPEDSIVVATDAVVLATRPVDGDVDVVHQLFETHDVLAGDVHAVRGEYDLLEPAPRIFQDFPEPLVQHRLAAREDDAAHARQFVDHGEHFLVLPHLDARWFRAVNAFQVAATGELEREAEWQVHRTYQFVHTFASTVYEVLVVVVKDQARQ